MDIKKVIKCKMADIKVYDVRIYPGDSAFLIDDGETAILYDTGFGFTGYAIADNIKKILGERKLNYIFLTHSHYDHALGSAYISEKYPDAVIVAGKYAAEIFKRPGAKAVMKELDSKIAVKYGVTDYKFLADRLTVDVAVDDGDLIKAGDMTFRALNLPGHTKCSIAYYCEENQLLLSCETLGVYNGKASIIPSILVGYADAISSIDKVRQLSIKNIVAPHVGLLNEMQTEYFLNNMKVETEKAANFIADRIKQGISKEDILKQYKAVYRNDFSDEAYPEDAANLNTSIMIELIRKEFNL